MKNKDKAINAFNAVQEVIKEINELSKESKYVFVGHNHYKNLKVSCFNSRAPSHYNYFIMFCLTEEGFKILSYRGHTQEEAEEALKILNNWKEEQE